MKPSAPESIVNWAAQVRAGDTRAISRAITAIENSDPRAEELLRELFPFTGRAYLIGVTGAPGTGKSTLVDKLAARYRAQDKTVGIIAVDPTSPYTGGAVLGDRIRMQGHATDSGIFIRSMATRGFFGGLARATADAALVLDSAGKQIVLIETVGVGQDEIDVVRLAECTLVLTVPGLGDDVQNMKAGLMEVADIFVLNKAEREGADRLEQQLHAMLELAPNLKDGGRGWKPPVIRTTATEGKGIGELADAIQAFREQREQSGAERAKILEYWKQRLLLLLETQLLARALDGDGQRVLESLASEVAERKKNPYTAVRELIARAGL
ncbi:MAG: methylmalonyl Co-A mutase-associated GTPase MeaB [Acidobacteria bacterium]|nr:MAG: methylmalonyl Co-A mutase-associated GTPase MeaB [Acidobacteriota bacterium]